MIPEKVTVIHAKKSKPWFINVYALFTTTTKSTQLFNYYKLRNDLLFCIELIPKSSVLL